MENEIVNTKHGHLRNIFVLAALCFFLPLAAFGAQAIMGAFGQTLGQRFDPASSIHSGLSRDEMWFEFMNETPLPVLSRFRVFVTPLTYQIHGILAEGTPADLQSCKDNAETLFAVIAQKYSSGEDDTILRRNTERTVFQIDQKKTGRKIGVLCEASGQLSVLYTDNSLKETARAQRKIWDTIYDDYQGKRFDSAIPLLKELADKDHMHAQLIMGYAFRNGHGVPQDDYQAEAYYLKAAKAGMLEAQFNLGTFCLSKNRLDEAQYWLEKAAERGSVAAQNNLAQMYLKDGKYYNEGEAFRWFLSAAESGHVEAQYNVCHMYSAGTGIARNEVNAYKWCDIAATQGHSKSRDNRDFIAKRMTPQEIERAKVLSQQWGVAKGAR